MIEINNRKDKKNFVKSYLWCAICKTKVNDFHSTSHNINSVILLEYNEILRKSPDIKQIACIKYCEFNIKELFEKGKRVDIEEAPHSLDGNVYKIIKEKEYYLVRSETYANDKYITQIWSFKKDFSKEDAVNFIYQFDEKYQRERKLKRVKEIKEEKNKKRNVKK